MNRYRTHTCGELRKQHEGTQVKISGWLATRRDHGGVLFLDLRDFYGLTQVVVQSPDVDETTVQSLMRPNPESILSIEGVVRSRPPSHVNPNLATGEIEVLAQAVEVLSPAAYPPPFPIGKGPEANEELRLYYRFLDLRRQKMRDMLVQRQRFCQLLRESFSARGFVEIHTPILSNSTPEGARDFIVPSRLHPGQFYALPQAPQQWKQILMASGVDRYFQIAPCFRDEPARADRTPGEFYQLDIEMAFVEEEDVLREVESLVLEIGHRFGGKRIVDPFPRITFKDAMERYGTDKPDMRFGLELQTLAPQFKSSNMRFLREANEEGGTVRGFAVPGGARFSRRELGEFQRLAKESGVQSLASLALSPEGARGSLAARMDKGEIEVLRKAFEAEDGTLVLLGAGPRKQIDTALSAVRLEIGNRLGLRDPDTLMFGWVLDFPIYEEDPETGQIIFSHNPFSMPKGGLEALNTLHPLEIIGQQYDLVCNGIEISSGAIRNNIPEAMYRAFEIGGYSRAQMDSLFGHMIRMYEYGAPPHGGIAPGIERLLMLFLGETSIREVIPFPKNQKCEDVMVNAPSELPAEQLRELGIFVSGIGS